MMGMYQSIGTASDRVMAMLLAGLEIEFGHGAGEALAHRFLEAEETDFLWDARIEERWLGSYESIDDDDLELDRIAICGRLDGRWFASVMLVDGDGMAHGTLGKRFCRSRKSAHHTLDDYVSDGIMSEVAADTLRAAVTQRYNILVAGGTSTGKTTLANALLAEMSWVDARVILIEDTRELQCPLPDTVALRTRPGVTTMTDLVRSTMRLRPDRIIVGEIRGPEALDMLKAWNTGHPGGIATVHANSAIAALYRIEQLVQEAVVTVPRQLIAEAIDMIVFITGRGTSRRIETIARVTGLGRIDIQHSQIMAAARKTNPAKWIVRRS
jgi:hypothetical protein